MDEGEAMEGTGCLVIVLGVALAIFAVFVHLAASFAELLFLFGVSAVAIVIGVILMACSAVVRAIENGRTPRPRRTTSHDRLAREKDAEAADFVSRL